MVINFEAEVYGREQPFVEPASVIDGLAVYRVGRGAPVLLFPYPHGHTIEPMAQRPLATSLVGLQRSIVSFDVPGAYRSTREPRDDIISGRAGPLCRRRGRVSVIALSATTWRGYGTGTLSFMI